MSFSNEHLHLLASVLCEVRTTGNYIASTNSVWGIFEAFAISALPMPEDIHSTLLSFGRYREYLLQCGDALHRLLKTDLQ